MNVQKWCGRKGEENQPKLCVCRVERRLNCIVLLIPKPLERLVESCRGCVPPSKAFGYGF